MKLNTTNPWHLVSYGDRAPDFVNGIIEIPMHTRAKYELDKESGLLRLDRVLYASTYYPANYGFIPQTYCDDGDPLDILVISQIESVPMCIISAKVIGVMRMFDEGSADDKIIAVAEHDMSVNHYDEIADLPAHFLKELRFFFEEYKTLEKKTTQVEEFLGADLAREIVKKAIADYRHLINSYRD